MVSTQIELNAAIGVKDDVSANEKRADSRRRCDMKLEDADNSVLLELVATETQAVIKKHFASAKAYGRALAVSEVWVIIFTVVDRTRFDLVWPSNGVHAMYIFHSAEDWAQREIVLQPPPQPRQPRRQHQPRRQEEQGKGNAKAAQSTEPTGRKRRRGKTRKEGKKADEEKGEKPAKKKVKGA